MKVMISQPFAGKSDEEIQATRKRAIMYLNSQGHEIVNTFFEGDTYDEGYLTSFGVKNIPMYFLGKSIEMMASCDAVYFCKGWKKARGCIIENAAAKAYGVKMIYE